MPTYEFQCERCEIKKEFRMKISEYDEMKDNLKCEERNCRGKMKRVVDYSGTFQLNGVGWFGKYGEGTGYEVTQRELDRNSTESLRLEDRVHKDMRKEGLE